MSNDKQGQRLIMAFDFGVKSIGIATGQEITGTANPLQSIKARDGIPDWQELGKIINEWRPDLLLVGLPLNMDGTEQELTHRAKKFANRLHGRFGFPVDTWDERLTTVDAKAQLFDQGGYRNLQKDKVDALSAKLILESWFENQY
ncbi:Holliday junction resolvase RuvX [Saccharobesus litoralis]|uniref:Putative pre-16S rRNA nuclease n=1 Tax=Saccharobesus litoralis TaxID=2172099 RepID=A0A2S0VSK9_9ALTE|nr:Holliday junction resolvase RuvX [Saccharobesus litoralis]AWB67201.1 Holliday junction resolvase RuvX [Saccharobesus litoralis]